MSDGSHEVLATWKMQYDQISETYLTDANGYDLMKREAYQDGDYFTGDFYPVDSSITVNEGAGDRSMTIWNDRPQAGSVQMADGSVKLLVQRNLVTHDSGGVNEGMYHRHFEKVEPLELSFKLLAQRQSEHGSWMARRERDLMAFSTDNFSKKSGTPAVTELDDLSKALSNFNVGQVTFTKLSSNDDTIANFRVRLDWDLAEDNILTKDSSLPDELALNICSRIFKKREDAVCKAENISVKLTGLLGIDTENLKTRNFSSYDPTSEPDLSNSKFATFEISIKNSPSDFNADDLEFIESGKVTQIAN